MGSRGIQYGLFVYRNVATTVVVGLAIHYSCEEKTFLGNSLFSVGKHCAHSKTRKEGCGGLCAFLNDYWRSTPFCL